MTAGILRCGSCTSIGAHTKPWSTACGCGSCGSPSVHSWCWRRPWTRSRPPRTRTSSSWCRRLSSCRPWPSASTSCKRACWPRRWRTTSAERSSPSEAPGCSGSFSSICGCIVCRSWRCSAASTRSMSRTRKSASRSWSARSPRTSTSTRSKAWSSTWSRTSARPWTGGSSGHSWCLSRTPIVRTAPGRTCSARGEVSRRTRRPPTWIPPARSRAAIRC
mmetsp:Transcript_71687/g.201079  ORF Transcript_71687/g.201079 Transcript_71687/m.201079 type:complete len:219 (-) Transcript_71687:219-875(-)